MHGVRLVAVKSGGAAYVRLGQVRSAEMSLGEVRRGQVTSGDVK